MTNERELIRTDRNGTKYWNVKDVCPRCGGIGDYICGINYGVCFLCGGTGIREYTYKEYTPEHEAELEAKRAARAAKRLSEQKKYEEEHAEEIAEEARKEKERRYAEFGCGKNGIGYALTGKTYPIKEEIKRQGGRWIYGCWVCPVKVDGKGVSAKEINLNGHLGGGSQIWLDDFDLYEAIHG